MEKIVIVLTSVFIIVATFLVISFIKRSIYWAYTLCTGTRIHAEMIGYSGITYMGDEILQKATLLFKYICPQTNEITLYAHYDGRFAANSVVDAIEYVPISYKGPISIVVTFSILQFPVSCSVVVPPDRVRKYFSPMDYLSIGNKHVKGFPPVIRIPKRDEILAAAGK